MENNQISNRCKNCGGELNFDPISNELKCKYCGSIVLVPETKSKNEKFDYDGTCSRLKPLRAYQYKCESCGCTHNAYADHMGFCPSCGSTRLTKVNGNGYEPDNILPFKITKEEALQKFSEWIASRHFAPNDLKAMVRDKKLTAFYVPVWSFDYDNHCSYEAKIDRGNHETVDIVRRTGHFDKHEHNKYLSANGFYPDEVVAMSAGQHMSGLCVFRPEFLYGYKSSDQNISIDKAYKHLRNVVDNENRNEVRLRLSGNVIELRVDTQIDNVKYNYNYLPLYVNHYKYKKKKYKCYISGASGKVQGRAPKSFWKIFTLVSGIVLGITAIAVTIALLV